MEHLNLITDCLITLYLNYYAERENYFDSPANKLVSDILAGIPTSAVNGDMNYEADSVEAIRRIINDMLTNSTSPYYKYEILILKLKQTCRRNPQVYESIELAHGYTKTKNSDELKTLVYDYTYKLRCANNDKKIRRLIREFSIQKTNMGFGDVDWDAEIQKLYEQITPLTSRNTSSILNESFICNVVDFENPETLQNSLTLAAKMIDPSMSIKTPFKILNKMMGEALGLPRPATITLASCTHNYKSGMMIDLAMGIPRFNKPVLKDPNKKPLNLFITLENETSTNIAQMYKIFKEQETGEKINGAQMLSEFLHNPKKMEEASNYIMSRMSINGWKTIMLRIDGSSFDYMRLFALLDHYQAQGYEIVTLLIDYLLMMSKRGCDQPAGTGSDSRDLLRRVRNYCMARNIILCTPLQLSTTAKETKARLLREEGHNPLAFLEELRRSNMYDTCRSLEQEIDLELFLDIITIQGKKHLAIGRGKHRGTLSETPEKHRIAIIPFSEAGRLLPDMETENNYGYHSVKEAQVAMGGSEYGGTWDIT